MSLAKVVDPALQGFFFFFFFFFFFGVRASVFALRELVDELGTWGTTRGTVGVRLGYGWGTVGVRVGYDLPRISPSGVRVGYGWGTVGVQVGYAGKFSVNRL